MLDGFAWEDIQFVPGRLDRMEADFAQVALRIGPGMRFFMKRLLQQPIDRAAFLAGQFEFENRQIFPHMLLGSRAGQRDDADLG